MSGLIAVVLVVVFWAINRQIETALHIDGWLSSTGQPPKSLG